MALTGRLAEYRDEAEKYALEYGLDFFDTIFEMVDYKRMNHVASCGGFPTRYPHWRFGMEYLRMSRSYAYGLHRIYEMVINNDPSYAYLLESNKAVHQKMVMAHVYGHVDFMKNNMWYAHTNRKMMDETANHSTRVRRIIDRIGYDEVERFIDRCLSIDNLIDIHSPGIERQPEEEEGECKKERVKKIPTEKRYMDEYINPDEYIEAQREKLKEKRQRNKKFPKRPERDIMLFLLENAPLRRWQQTILSIIHEEAYYFAPQGQTKIMNEGWASYWHSKIMTEKLLEPNEIIDYAEHHAGTMGTRPGQLNPYKLGLELFRDIERRWDQGKFGKEWEECNDAQALANWDKELGLGRKKIFEVRKIYNDIGFISNFLTPEFARRQKLFTYEHDGEQFVISDRKFEEVKDKLLFSLTNFGQPIVRVVNGNYSNKGELLLEHQHEGIDLKQDWAKDTLANLEAIWGRPVWLSTIVEEEPTMLGIIGGEYKEK